MSIGIKRASIVSLGVLIVATGLAIAFGNFASAVGGTITITSPVAGEEITRGTSYTIEWTSSNIPAGDGVSIALYNPTHWAGEFLTLDTENDGSFVWDVSSNLAAKSGYYITFTGVEGNSDSWPQFDARADSGTFSVTAAETPVVTKTIVSPASEVVVSGVVKIITSSSSSTGSPITNVSLRAIHDNAYDIASGAPWISTLFADFNALYEFDANWDTTTVPDGPTFIEMIATEAGGQSSVAASGIWVTVENSPNTPLVVTSPVEGAEYFTGDDITIEWMGAETVPTVLLSYTINSGANEIVIGRVPNTGSYTWTPPESWFPRASQIIVNNSTGDDEIAYSGTFSYLAPVDPEYTPIYTVSNGGNSADTSSVVIEYVSIPSYAVSLRLYVSTVKGGEGNILLDSLSITESGLTLNVKEQGFLLDTPYYFTIRAVAENGLEESNKSTTSVVFPNYGVDTIPPEEPTTLITFLTYAGNPSAISLTYTFVPEDAAFLRLYSSTQSGVLGTLILDNLPPRAGAIFGFIEQGLDWGTTQYLTLRAVDVSGNESMNISTKPTVIPDALGSIKGNGRLAIKVIAPESGKIVRQGEIVEIQWEVIGITSKHSQIGFEVTILDSVSDMWVVQPTISLGADVRSYSWLVPEDFPEGIYRPRIGAGWVYENVTSFSSSVFNPYFVVVDSTDVIPEEDKGCLPDGTLVKLPNDAKIYVIENCNRRWIRSESEFDDGGYKWIDVRDVAEDIILQHPDLALEIRNRSLFRIDGSPDVFVVRNGVLHKIPDPATLSARMLNMDNVQVVGREYLKGMPRGFGFIPEGTIFRARGTNDVWIVKYVREKQFKRLVLNPRVFESYGHLRWEDVRDVDQGTINAFPTATLVRVVGTNIVYRLIPNGDIGVRQRMSSARISEMGLDIESVYEINGTDFVNYTEGESLE